MGVRVRVRVEAGERKVETSALVNSGFESEVPLIILPLRVAEALGFSPKGLEEESYLGAGGVAVILYSIPKKLRLSVVTEDRTVGPVKTRACISLGEKEVILSDAASSELGISIEDLKRGVWRFADENKRRASARKEEWI
ncbi:MAG: hypothetical protein QXH26_05445 [Candidatus Hadarchaeales archaeon]